MLNHIVLMGRLTRDPELRYTQSQIPVASFSLAVDRDFGGRDGGERQTDFIDIVAWRSTAEFVSKYFTKGSMAVVSGRLQIRDWTDREGGKRRSAEVVADNVYFGESKRRDGGDTSRPAAPSTSAPAHRGASPLPVRAQQDPAAPHDRYLRDAPARAHRGHQESASDRPPAVRDRLSFCSRMQTCPHRTMGAGFCYVPVQLSRCSGIFSTCAMQETITRICGVSTLSRWCTS